MSLSAENIIPGSNYATSKQYFAEKCFIYTDKCDKSIKETDRSIRFMKSGFRLDTFLSVGIHRLAGRDPEVCVAHPAFHRMIGQRKFIFFLL